MKRYISIICALLGLVSCAEKEAVVDPSFCLHAPDGTVIATLESGSDFTLTLENNAYATKASGAVLKAPKFVVDGNMDWKVSLVEPEVGMGWIRIFPDEGRDEGAFCFLVEENESFEKARSATFSLLAQRGGKVHEIPATITVYQKHLPPSLKLSDRFFSVPVGGGDIAITVTCNAAWEYNVVYGEGSPSAWLSDKSSLDGSSKQTLRFDVAENTDDERTARIDIWCPSAPELVSSVEVVQKGVAREKWQIVWYDAILNVASDKDKNSFATYVWTPEGSGASTATYSAGSTAYHRTSTKQGTGNYLDYDNSLIQDVAGIPSGDSRLKATPGGCIQVMSGSTSETWFRVENIGIEGISSIKFGLGLFVPLNTTADAMAANPFTVYYHFDDTDSWSEWSVINPTIDNWRFYTIDSMIVPQGAKMLSLMINYPGGINCRYDDFTLIGIAK